MLTIGIALMAAGPFTFAIRRHWENSRITTALRMPISLAAATARSDRFEGNLRYYAIAVQLEKPYPTILESCLNGPRAQLYSCNQEPRLEAHWRLWSDGKIVAEGLDHPYKTFPDRWLGYGPVLERTLGYFECAPRRPYVLDVTFSGDTASLKESNAWLVVKQPAPDDRWFHIDDLLFPVCFTGMLFGGLLVAFAPLAGRRKIPASP